MEIETESLTKPLHGPTPYPDSYSDIGFFSSLTFSWVLSAYRKSLQSTLQPEHLIQVPFSETVAANQLPYSRSVLRSVFRKYKWQLLAGLSISVLAGSMEFTLPLYMLYLEGFLESRDSVASGLWSVAVLMCVLGVRLLLWRSIVWLEKRVHLRVQIALITLVYGNILTATTNVATSEVVNELEVDVQRAADGCLYFFWISSCFTMLVISLVILISSVGSSSYLGLGFVSLIMLANLCAADKGNGMYDRIMLLKDERMKFSMELFSSIKMLKMAVWENALLKRVKEVRRSEGAVLNAFMLIWSGMLFSLWCTPIIATIVTFATSKWLFGEEMTVETAFTTIAVFYLLQGPLLWMPGCITWLLSSVSSSRRIDVS